MRNPALPIAKGEPVDRSFSHLITVEEAEMDELDHVSNVAYLQWVQDVARNHTDTIGYTIPKYKEIGGVFVVQKHQIQYATPTFTGDHIRVATWVEDWTRYYCTRHTHIMRVSDGALAAKCETTWVWLGLPSYKPRRIPTEVNQAFSGPTDPSLCDNEYVRQVRDIPMGG